jgi:putative transposase
MEAKVYKCYGSYIWFMEQITSEKSASSATYNINYHFVWCPKYRKCILNNELATALQRIIESICISRGWEILELKIMPDHVHLFVSPKPYDSPTIIIKILKGVSARLLFNQYPELVTVYRRGHLWSPSYYVGTAGNISAETIKRYIQDQESKKR